MSSKILVTGATGLVGSHLINKLSQQGKQVKALYHNTLPPTVSSVEWVKTDILDMIELEDVMTDIHQVYHCAAIVSFDPKHKQTLYATNVQGTANIINASLEAGVEKLVYISSVAALGRNRKDDRMIDETMSWVESASTSEYGKSKHLAEMEVWRGQAEGLNTVIVNPSIILGASDWNKGSSALFKSIYNEFPWYSEGVTGFVDVEDVAKAMVALMDSDITGKRFILNAGNITYKELFTLMAHAFGKKVPHKKVTPLMAAIVWRLEALKSKLTGKSPLVTRETAHTAQTVVKYDNAKILSALPGFQFKPLKKTVEDICIELKKKYDLN